MMYRTFFVCAWALILSAQLSGQDRMRYREFELGANLASIARLTGVAPSEARLVHQRPSVMTELEWRPRYFSRGVSPQTDPVDVMVFSFYDDQLFKVVVDYDRRRTEGLTAADLIDAIAVTYGPPSKPLAKASRAAQVDRVADVPLATWGDSEYSVTLLRVVYPETYKLIVASTGLETLARAAATEAVRLDTREAPQREIVRKQKEIDDALAAEQKMKTENKAVFRP